MHWFHQKPGHVKNHWGMKSALAAAEQQPELAKPTVTEPAKPWTCEWHPTEEPLPAAPALPVHPTAQASISAQTTIFHSTFFLQINSGKGRHRAGECCTLSRTSNWSRAGPIRTAFTIAVRRGQGGAERSTKAVASAQERLHCSAPASASTSTVCSWRASQTMQPRHQSQGLQGTGCYYAGKTAKTEKTCRNPGEPSWWEVVLWAQYQPQLQEWELTLSERQQLKQWKGQSQVKYQSWTDCSHLTPFLPLQQSAEAQFWVLDKLKSTTLVPPATIEMKPFYTEVRVKPGIQPLMWQALSTMYLIKSK